MPVLEFREECRDYAQHWLNVQSAEFQRLGVEGDWANRYATMDFASEAAIAGEIGKFLLNGALYRGLRPVMWCPVEKTALAEAEVEYYDKKDTAIYVRFRAGGGLMPRSSSGPPRPGPCRATAASPPGMSSTTCCCASMPWPRAAWPCRARS